MRKEVERSKTNVLARSELTHLCTRLYLLSFQDTYPTTNPLLSIWQEMM